MYLCYSRRHSLPQVMRSFPSFLFAALRKLRTSSVICSFSFSSFKLDLVDLNVIPHLHMRLAKIKPFRTICSLYHSPLEQYLAFILN